MALRSFARVSSSIAVVGLFAACGGDDGGSGDLDAFCEEFRRAEEGEPVSIDEDFDAGMAEMERIRDLAPGEVRDDIDVILDAFRDLEEAENDADGDDEEFAAAIELLLNPRFTQATDALEAFGVDECGIAPAGDAVSTGDAVDVSAGESDSASGAADDASTGEQPDGRIVTEAAPGVPDPLFDPIFDDEVDLGEVSYRGAQYYLDVNYTDAPWRTRLGSWTSFGSTPPELEVGGLDLTEAEANEVCAALVEYLAPFDPDSALVVKTYGQNADGSFGDEEPMLSTTAADGC